MKEVQERIAEDGGAMAGVIHITLCTSREERE